ncbi:hypothetical protein MPSEU_000243600 [Mayamaea pseudoterrestris]|nr:hypothetical protein MPSEU_000243600 [Mayamaea pseudoterrestris]
MKRKTEKTESDSTKKVKKFDKETVEARGFCTQPDLRLSAELVEAVASGTTSDKASDEIVTQKDLLGEGRSKKELHLLRNKEDSKMIVFYYSGKRFVKKDREHLISFIDAARKARTDFANAQAYVLLAAASGICKRNALPDLCKAGIIVQRE